jgi:formate-nitrite transporter family protein
VEEAFDRLVSEGSDRLARPLVPLLATGFLGGIDVGIGVSAYLVVDHETGQPLLAAAVFPIGFIALLLARSELFTESFLVPVTARVAGRGSWFELIRLWLVTLAANLAGGIVMAGLIVVARPDLDSTAARLGRHYATLGISWRSLLLAILAGVVITLLTRMQHATDDLGPKLVAAVAMSFVLVAAQLFHSVLDSILMFTGLLGGQATYTWGDWALAMAWSALGNVIGGVGLVTSIRLLRVPHRVAEERAESNVSAETYAPGALMRGSSGASLVSRLQPGKHCQARPLLPPARDLSFVDVAGREHRVGPGDEVEHIGQPVRRVDPPPFARLQADAEAGDGGLVGVDRRLAGCVRRARDTELLLVPQVYAGLVADLDRGRQTGEDLVPGADHGVLRLPRQVRRIEVG